VNLTFPLASLCLLAIVASAQAAAPEQAAPSPGATVRTLTLRDGAVLITTPNGNVAALLGDEGVALAGTPGAVFRAATRRALDALVDNPAVRYIIDTSADAGAFSADDAQAFVFNENDPLFKSLGISAASMRVIGQENVLARMSAAQAAAQLPQVAIPTDAYITPTIDFDLDGSAIQTFHVANAHSDGDSLVHFRRADVLAVGEVIDMINYPVIDRARGGSIRGEIDALNRILDIAVPGEPDEGGTLVIPARGRLVDEADVAEYRNMMVIIRDRIQDLIQQGKTLEQVYRAQPTLDYDGLYGHDEGPWTTRQFIAALYADLKKK
jgi:hypothetical protein